MIFFKGGFPYSLIIISLILLDNCESTFKQTIYESFSESWNTLNMLAGSLLHGVKDIVKSMKYVEDLIDSTIDEECKFTCKENEYSVPDPTYIVLPNGCGSFGIILKKDELPVPEMEECCNQHDMCYSICGADKDVCDLQFKKCLYRQCESNKNEKNLIKKKICKGSAKVLYTTTTAVGCAPFKEAQQLACKCIPIKRNEL